MVGDVERVCRACRNQFACRATQHSVGRKSRRAHGEATCNSWPAPDLSRAVHVPPPTIRNDRKRGRPWTMPPARMAQIRRDIVAGEIPPRRAEIFALPDLAIYLRSGYKNTRQCLHQPFQQRQRNRRRDPPTLRIRGITMLDYAARFKAAIAALEQFL
jgi:hypothetical protein